MKRRRLIPCAAWVLLAACGHPHPDTAASAPASVPGASTVIPPVTRFTASADGLPIGWHQYGHGDPAVVLVHGWAEDSTIWRAQLAVLAAHYTVVTLDLGGQGVSGATRRSWSLANFAQDVAAVAAVLPNPRIVLVGQGMGGPVALEAAPLIGARLRASSAWRPFVPWVTRTAALADRTGGAALPQRLRGRGTQVCDRDAVPPRSDPTLVRTVADLMAHTAPQRGVDALHRPEPARLRLDSACRQGADGGDRLGPGGRRRCRRACVMPPHT